MPRILFTHVPFSRRAEERSCDIPWRSAFHGVFRESHRSPLPGGEIFQGGDTARTYQNLVREDVTNYVLKNIQPAVVFSGDDHDHCEVIHQKFRQNQIYSVPGFNASDVPELTVKSMSMTEGVRRPGYAWLQLTSEGHGIDYMPCVLPNQIFLWTGIYLPLFVLTMAYLLVRHGRYEPVGSLLPSHASITPHRTRTLRFSARSSNILGRLRRLARQVGLIGFAPLLLWLFLQS